MSFLFSQPRGVVKTPTTLGEISTSRKVVTCLLFIYLHRDPFPPPVYGIISRCPMYRIQVASDSADNLSSFRLLLEFIWSESEIQQPIEKFSKVALVRDWTRDHLFTGVSPPKSCYSQWKHIRFFFVYQHKASWRSRLACKIVVSSSTECDMIALISYLLSLQTVCLTWALACCYWNLYRQARYPDQDVSILFLIF